MLVFKRQIVDMKKIVHVFLISFFFSFLLYNNAVAQIENADALPKQFDLLGQETMFTNPNLLQSSYAGLNEIAQFNGFSVNWVPRGLTQNKGNRINGIYWQAELSGWDPGFSFAGLYGAMKVVGVSTSYGVSQFGLGGQSGTSFLSTHPSLFNKSRSFTTRLSNANTMHEIRLQWHSGLIKKKLWINVDALYQTTPLGYLVNGLKSRKGIALSAEKIISSTSRIGLNFWWSPAVQGKRAPTVQEMFGLSKDLLYNPSWGWRNGQPFYANTKKSNVPVTGIHYSYENNKGTTIQINIGAALGVQSSTQLDWSKAADPRPDYYKYLPSFAIDPVLQNKLYILFASHPDQLQVQFDQLVAQNKQQKNGDAKYIINERLQNVKILRGSLMTGFFITPNIHWTTGVDFFADKIEYESKVADLLGGQFYYNYNTWVNDDGIATAFQNDLGAPNRRIRVGEKWGANYLLYNKKIQVWTGLTGSNRRLEWGLGMHTGLTSIRRNGLNQNGLFPDFSKGESAISVFPFNQYQFFIRYKMNGRWYLTTSLYQEGEAPNASELFTDPSNHAFINPFLLPLIHQGAEVKFHFMGSNFKANAMFFAQLNKNDRQYKLFYHDYYNAFVRASVGQMHAAHIGVESYVETNWSSPIQLSLANSYGWYTFVNDPIYEIRLSDNLYKVQSGQLFLKQFPATSHPQSVQAFTANFQPIYSLRLGCTVVYASRRAISHDYFRRSDWVQTHSINEEEWKSIFKPEWAPDQWVSNLFVSKSFMPQNSKNKLALRLTASVRNLFNNKIPSLIFEQSRFDYKSFVAEKFPAKYIYDLGRTYTIGIQCNFL